MSDENKVRLAHELLDEVNAREDLTPEQVGVLRSFLPERPERKTLEDVYREVCNVWYRTDGDVWKADAFGELEDWLRELYEQLKGLIDSKPVNPTRPEFLETVEDYENAPQRTIVAIGDAAPWMKLGAAWVSATWSGRSSELMDDAPRRVLRWGNK